MEAIRPKQISQEVDQLLEALVLRGTLTQEQIEEKKKLFVDTAIEKGPAAAVVQSFTLSEEIVAETIAKTFGYALTRIEPEIKTAPANLLTDDEIQRFRALPVLQVGLELTIAFVDPPTRASRTEIQRLTDLVVLPVITTLSDFEAALKKYRGALDRLQRAFSKINLEEFDIQLLKGDLKKQQAIADTETTMSELADEILLRAAKSGASDIHIEPTENEVLIRFRLDGVLQRIASLPLSFNQGLVLVLKAKSNIDIFERSIPQDGRFSLNIADRSYDVRVNSLPIIYGEKVVLRLLSKSGVLINLENLGFSKTNLEMFRSLLHLPHGIILVTGPTGSGKTTTLYAGLSEIKSVGRNIVTVENPVEYRLNLINQVQVNPDRGLTFAAALRAILRQDPNVILVGEIRDSETGIIATEAALTGHLVLTTLHTNDAIGAIPRLINLGIESFWVGASVIGILAQRLIRQICLKCKEEYQPDEETLYSFGLSELPSGTTLFQGRGCSHCTGSGYRGRIAIHEILIVTEEMRDVIYGEVTSTKLRHLAVANNFKDMFFDGIQKALAGITTLDEVKRVARRII